MMCTTCGRENPPHLTFCQECGQRLGPRIAPPTPPIGLGAQDSTAGAYGAPPAPQYAPPPPPQPQPQEAFRPVGQIPHAPPAPVDPRALPPRVATSLGMTARADGPPAHMTPPPPPPYVPQPAPQIPQAAANPAERRCKICDTVNGPNLRYCTSCGSTLDAGPALASTAAATPQQQPENAIAPMRVVDLAVGKPAGQPRTCSRCRGVADPGAQFCKFCGASLGDPIPQANGSAPKLPEAGDAYAPTPGAPNVNLGAGAPGAIPPRAPTAPMPMREPPLMPRPVRDSGDQPIPQPSPAYGAPEAQPRPAPQPLRDPYGPPPVAPPASAYGPPPAAREPAPTPPQTPVAQPQPQPQPPPPPAGPVAPPAPALQPSRAPQAGPTRGRLVVIAKSGADGPSYPFGDAIDVGRSEGNIVVGEDPYLSPRHVRIVFQNGKLLLRDLQSTNGVYLRLAPIRDMRGSPNPGGETSVPLVDHDLILVGQQVLRFDILEARQQAEGGLGPAQEHGTLLFGSPAATRYARLSQRTVEGITRDVYYVRKVETVLGRESGDVVFTEDPFLSRRHAAIRVLTRDGSPLAAGAKLPANEAPRFALVDLGSSNGTFLRIRADVELHTGDHFRVGQQLFRVDLTSEKSA